MSKIKLEEEKKNNNSCHNVVLTQLKLQNALRGQWEGGGGGGGRGGGGGGR